MNISFIYQLKNIDKARFEKPIITEPMSTIIEKIKDLYQPDECECLNNLIRCQKIIITTCKQNDITQTIEVISLSKILLRQLKNEPKILGKIFLYPSLSYYYFKVNNFRLSNYYINQTIKFDDLLTYKFPILHLHKLHHIINLHKVLLKKKEYEKCANLFLNIFDYLICKKTIDKYGNFNRTLLNNINEIVPPSSIIDGFSRSYLVCVLEYPEIEHAFLQNMKIQYYFKYGDPSNRYITAFNNYNFIQNSLNNNVIQYSSILKFFKENDFYHFDTYKLLIIKRLFNMTNSKKIKNILIGIIKEKLNFKEPELIIESFIKPL